VFFLSEDFLEVLVDGAIVVNDEDASISNFGI